MISKYTIERVKEAADIVSVVQDFQNIKKKGTTWVGFSPFNKERTPSFFIYKNAKFKCFSSGKQGGVIEYLIEAEKMTFVDALVYLANKYGIPVEYEVKEVDESHRKRESIMHLNKRMLDFFTWCMRQRTEDTSNAGRLLLEKGMTKDHIVKRNIGHCPYHNGLVHYLQNQYSPELLHDASAATLSNGNLYEYFRGRVVFPIYNLSGKVVGFTGRSIYWQPEAHFPKYLHSRNSEVFSKDKIVYNLYQARTSILRENSVFVVEGPTDCESFILSGIENVVSGLGSDFGHGCIQNLLRYTTNIVGVFDGDSAGRKASVRFIQNCVQMAVVPNVVFLPSGQDPNDVFLSSGAQGLKQCVGNQSDPVSALFLALDYSDSLPIKQKREILQMAIDVISKCSDMSLREMMVKRASEASGISQGSISREIKERNQEPFSEPKKAPVTPRQYIESRIIGVLHNYWNQKLFLVHDDELHTAYVRSWIFAKMEAFGLCFEREDAHGIFSVLQSVEDEDCSVPPEIPVELYPEVTHDEFEWFAVIEKVIIDWFLLQKTNASDADNILHLKEYVRTLPLVIKKMRAINGANQSIHSPNHSV